MNKQDRWIEVSEREVALLWEWSASTRQENRPTFRRLADGGHLVLADEALALAAEDLELFSHDSATPAVLREDLARLARRLQK